MICLLWGTRMKDIAAGCFLLSMAVDVFCNDSGLDEAELPACLMFFERFYRAAAEGYLPRKAYARLCDVVSQKGTCTCLNTLMTNIVTGQQICLLVVHRFALYTDLTLSSRSLTYRNISIHNMILYRDFLSFGRALNS